MMGHMRRPWLVLLLASGLCAACRVAAVVPAPLLGPAPQSIAVWPAATAAGPHAQELLDGLDRAARTRGYRVQAAAVTERLLADAAEVVPPPSLEDLPGLGRLLDVDALLALEVRAFAADGEPLRSSRWDLQWRLLSTRGHGTLWSFDHAGAWALLRDEADPQRRLDAEPEVVPIGGDRARRFRGVPELAADLHRLAMDHLPARSR